MSTEWMEGVLGVPPKPLADALHEMKARMEARV